jgi:D-alanyl-D-alanine carboxypeptidase
VASGFNLATSAVQNGRRMIGVILGGRSVRSRDESMAQLLDLGFGDLARAPATAIVQRETPATPVAAATPTPAVVAEPARQAGPSIADLAAASMALPPAAQAARTPAPPIPDQPPAREASSIAAVASAAIKHLAPVARAEAAEPAEAWGIQLGAYRGEAAAERAERQVAHLALARGKQAEILAPSAGERLYRLRLLHFSSQGAHAACEELRRQRQGCTVVPPGSVKVASR